MQKGKYTYSSYAEKWTEKLSSKKNFSQLYIEKPAMYQKVGDVAGKRILCLGCGSGEECNYMKQHGAKEVVGIDIAEGMIQIARKKFPGIRFIHGDMTHIPFADNNFDIIYSSLAFDYVKDWDTLFRILYKKLKPEGILLFSSYHPLKWSAQSRRAKSYESFIMGYEKDSSRSWYKIYGDYFHIRKVTDVLFNELEITYYTRPFSSMLAAIDQANFSIQDFEEPKPLLFSKSINPISWKIRQRIPIFLIFKLKKKEKKTKKSLYIKLRLHW